MHCWLDNKARPVKRTLHTEVLLLKAVSHLPEALGCMSSTYSRKLPSSTFPLNNNQHALFVPLPAPLLWLNSSMGTGRPTTGATILYQPHMYLTAILHRSSPCCPSAHAVV